MATKTGAQNHTHKYFRHNDIWHCGLGKCTHFMPKNIPQFKMIGRPSICWECEKEFELSPDELSKDRPFCEECRIKINQLEEYMKEKGLAI